MDQSQLKEPGSFEAFFKANKGLMHRVAKRVFNRALAMGAAVELGDIEQEASLVMMRAWQRFDPDKGFKFSTYYMRAAYNELNAFLKSYEQDIQVLGVFSLEAATDDDGERIDLESRIDGGHGSPEQMLETKQLLEQIKRELSPAASTILEVMLDPPDAISREWAVQRELKMQWQSEMTMAFVIDYLHRVSGVSRLELQRAGAEIARLGRSLNA